MKAAVVIALCSVAIVFSGCGPSTAMLNMAKTYSTMSTEGNVVIINEACKVVALDRDSGTVKWTYDKKVESEVCQKESK